VPGRGRGRTSGSEVNEGQSIWMWVVEGNERRERRECATMELLERVIVCNSASWTPDGQEVVIMRRRSGVVQTEVFYGRDESGRLWISMSSSNASSMGT